MISVPDFFVGGVCRFEFVLRKPSDGVTPINADSIPTIVVIKNGSDTVESATVATTGVTGGYKVSYTPGSYAEGDFYAFRVTAAITDADFNGGSAFSHVETFTTRLKAVERGTDGANTTAPATPANVTDARDAVLGKLPETGRANAVAPLDAVGTRNAIGLAAANLDTMLQPLAKLDTTFESDGDDWKFTEPALANAPGGESSIDPQPIIDGVLAGLPQPLVVESPTVASPGRLTALVRGCDYKTADGNPITVTVSTSANLDGATITLTAGRNGQTITATGAAVAHETIENRWIVTLEATATQTNKPAGDYVGIIKAVLTSGRVHPIGQNLTIPLRDVA